MKIKMNDVLSKGKACCLERVKGSVQNGQMQTFDNRLLFLHLVKCVMVLTYYLQVDQSS